MVAWIDISLAADKDCPADPIYLLPHIELLEDPSRSLTIEQINQPIWANRFRKNLDGQSNFGFSRSAFWVRINHQIPVDCGQKWMLEIAWSRLDTIEFFRRDGEGWRHITTGDTHPYASRDVDHHHFVFRIPGQSANAFPYYLRVKSKGPIWLPMTLWSDQGFANRAVIELLFYGLFFGMFCGLILYNLIVYLSVRDHAYFYYLCTLISALLCFLVNAGFSMRFLWPLAPAWDNLSLWFFGLLAGCAYLEFARRILELRYLSSKLDLTMRAYATGGLCVTVAVLIFDYAIMSRIASTYFISGLPITLYSIIISSKKGNPLARYVGLAFLVSVFGFGVPILYYLFGSHVPAWMLYISPLGGLAEAILLSLALGERIKQLHRQKLSAQTTLLESQRKFARQLIAAQDTELRRVASELHDGIGQNLLVINNRLNRLKNQSIQPILPDKLRLLAKVAQQTIHDVRAISHRLHPHQLDRLGLTSAIDTMANEILSDAGITLICQIDAIDNFVDKDQALHLYRIVQEAIKNIIHHAKADTVKVTLNQTDALVQLKISDNGRGIDESWFDKHDYSKAFGLSSIQERVHHMQGAFDLSNHKPKGLKLEINIPLTRNKVNDNQSPDRG